MKNNKINIRNMKISDCEIISNAFKAQGWDKSSDQYKSYFNEQQNSKIEVFIAEYDNEFAGYITIKWKTNYKPFQKKNIPEIKDLNTLIKFRNKGIATLLMEKAEERIKEKGYSAAGLGVGLYSDYGTAQRMYVKRGYNFDCNGLMYGCEKVLPGKSVTVDDNLCLFMTKELKG